MYEFLPVVHVHLSKYMYSPASYLFRQHIGNAMCHLSTFVMYSMKGREQEAKEQSGGLQV